MKLKENNFTSHVWWVLIEKIALKRLLMKRKWLVVRIRGYVGSSNCIEKCWCIVIGKNFHCKICVKYFRMFSVYENIFTTTKKSKFWYTPLSLHEWACNIANMKMQPTFIMYSHYSQQRCVTSLTHTHTHTHRYLLNICLDINQRNTAGATPLELATSQGHSEVVRYVSLQQCHILQVK